MVTSPTRTPVPQRFLGKVAVVTGGTNGIGHAIALELLREGAQVVVSGLPADLEEGLVDGPGGLVWPLVGHRVVGVGDRHDPGREGYLLAAQSRAIALTVPSLVVVERDLSGDEQDRGVSTREDLRTDVSVLLNYLKLLFRQLSGFEQDRVGHADLSDVV